MVYTCVCCDYTTNRQGNYLKHLQTNKHIQQENNNKQIKKYECNICGKSYLHNQSLYNHKKKTCKNMNDKNTNGENTNNKNMNNENNKANNFDELETKNKKLTEQNEQLKKENEQFKKKDNDINTLNSFSNTNKTPLMDNVYKNLILNNDDNNAMLNLLKLKHININKVDDMNILITNLKDSHMKIFEDGNWIVVDRKLHMQQMLLGQFAEFTLWYNSISKHMGKKLREKYYDMQRHYTQFFNEIKTKMTHELYNNRCIISKK
jgi:hypothetical protein